MDKNNEKDTKDYDSYIYEVVSKNIKYYRLNNKSKYADEYGKITKERLDKL